LKQLTFILFLLFSSLLFGYEPIVLTNENLGNSFTKSALILEDADHLFSVNDILANSELPFVKCEHDIEKIDFTSSIYWLKFEVVNESGFDEFLIEIARVITDKVTLYEYHNGVIDQVFYGGDLITYEKRSINNLNNTFPLKLNKNEKKYYILKLESDGENISLPLIINSTNEYHIAMRNHITMMGAYYGILIIISFLYLFYYFGMKERSFLLYTIYVLSIFMLQFSVDGYSYFYLFRN